jgi:methyl-accepting chemotaxis protein
VLVSKAPGDTLRRTLDPDEAFGSARRGASGHADRKGAGETRLVGYFKSAGFSGYPGLGWTVLVSEKESEVLAAAAALERDLLLFALVAAPLIGLMAFLLARALTRRISRYSTFARQVSQGDLTARLEVDGNDELAALGIHLNEMVEELSRVSTGVTGGAQAISASVGQILATVNEHTASASQQSAAIVETTSSVEQVRVSAEQAASRAEEVAAKAQLSVQVGEDGFSAVEAITTGMSDIQQHVDLITQNILNLSDQTQQIGEITTTVSELAGQSNLLAFNAAIEAAKAGEHGKGFAVVAEEVRNLAEQSKQATVQVQGILGEIQKATRSTVDAAQEGSATVQANASKAQRAGEVIGELADINRDASQAAQQISALVRQQSIAMDQIAQAMTETGQATQQFVVGAGESQLAAEQLDGVARELRSAVSAYKV